MAIKRSDEIKKLISLNDKVADIITRVAGSMTFLLLNVVWFLFWILLNTGAFGKDMIIDPFPFSFLTTAVSLEAIILSTFVLMSQRRQSKIAEIRTELDYRTDVEAEIDVKAVVGILERIAAKQDIDVSDLLKDMQTKEKKSVREGERN
jgi:uncharacterized membrane protein